MNIILGLVGMFAATNCLFLTMRIKSNLVAVNLFLIGALVLIASTVFILNSLFPTHGFLAP